MADSIANTPSPLRQEFLEMAGNRRVVVLRCRKHASYAGEVMAMHSGRRYTQARYRYWLTRGWLAPLDDQIETTSITARRRYVVLEPLTLEP